jgi:FAD/FMN-containing dehydrogenase
VQLTANNLFMSERPNTNQPRIDAQAFSARARQVLGTEAVLTDPASCALYERDSLGRSGCALAVLLPASTAQTIDTMKLCAEFNVAVVPQAGNTGLVGASTPDETAQQVVLSVRRMDAIEGVDILNRSISVGAGVPMSRLQQHLAAAGMWFPFEIAADPCVGGMIATNTGGSHLTRYGDVRTSVLGIEAVLADGTVIDSMKALRKDNTGFDCKQLFIGSGGTLGVITRAVLAVYPKPMTRVSALLVPHSHAAVPGLLQWLETRYGELLTTFEGMSGEAIRHAYNTFPHLHRLFGDTEIPHYAVLVELASSCEFHAESLAADVRASLARSVDESVAKAALTADPEEYWKLRDAIPLSLMKARQVLSLDVSFPRSRLVRFRAAVEQLLRTQHPQAVLADFGHFADGGDHLTVVIPDHCATRYPPLLMLRLRGQLYDLVAAHGGSYSAEHGIGPLNESVYRRHSPPVTRRLHGAIKQLLDPTRRLGRGRFV